MSAYLDGVDVDVVLGFFGAARAAPAAPPADPLPALAPVSPLAGKVLDPYALPQVQAPPAVTLTVPPVAPFAGDGERRAARALGTVVLASLAGMVLVGGAGALLWTSHRFLGFLLGAVLLGGPAGAAAGAAIAARQVAREKRA